MFVMPVHGRQRLAQICMRQLRWTCDELGYRGVHASAVIVGDDDNLDTARDLGFGTVVRDNEFTSRKFNDGIELACSPRYNPEAADYVVPVGSDDWVHPNLFNPLPPADTMYAFQRMSFVREDGRELTVRHLRVEGGCGIRIYPRQVMEPLGYRPADEHRRRACDTSILSWLKTEDALRTVEHRVSSPLWIVDWKSPGNQLNPYGTVDARHPAEMKADPFEALQGVYPDDSLDDMRAHYEHGLVAA